MNRRCRARRPDVEPLAAVLRQTKVGTEYRLRGRRTKQAEHIGADDGELAFPPLPACPDLGAVRLFVDPHLAAPLELEVLHRVGEIHIGARDAGLLERFVEEAAGGSDEGMAF